MSTSHENLPPQVITRLIKELRKLSRSPPEGIKFIPNIDDRIGEIHAEIEGPEGTPYVSGSWNVKLVLGPDFPTAPPRGYFLTPIFHPNIAKNGDICVNTLKKDWKPDMGISHVLQVIRCLLIVPFPESSLNDEAGRMFMESYDEYAQRARLMTRIHALKAAADSAGSKGQQGGEGDRSDLAEGKGAKKKKAGGAKKKKKSGAKKKRSLKRL